MLGGLGDYRKRAAALEAYLDELFERFEKERTKRAEEHLRTVFRTFDADGSGAIDHEEFAQACRRLNPVMTPDDVEDAITTIDGDGDGEISIDEFRRWWNSDHGVLLREAATEATGGSAELDEVALVREWEASRARLEHDKLRRAFSSIDEDGSGLLEYAEFRRLCRRIDARISDEDIKRTFEAIDSDGSGEVDFEEFATWWDTPAGRALRGEEGEAPPKFSAQELCAHARLPARRCLLLFLTGARGLCCSEEAVAARASERRAERAQRKFRVSKQKVGWDAARAKRAALRAARDAAVEIERRLAEAKVRSSLMPCCLVAGRVVVHCCPLLALSVLAELNLLLPCSAGLCLSVFVLIVSHCVALPASAALAARR